MTAFVAKWSSISAAVVLICAGFAGCIGGGGVSGSLSGAACVSGVLHVATGTEGSLYIQDSRGIVHYSRKGKLLAVFGPKSGDWTVDKTGDVYYLSGRDILKVSPTGKVLFRWAARMMEPEAVNPANGDVLAVYGGGGYAGTGPDPFELFSPTGRMIHRWSSSYDAALAFDTAGNVVATGQIGAELVAFNPLTGKTILRTPRTLGAPYSLVGSDEHGHIFIGGENRTDTPFTVERVTIRGGKFHFKTLNSSEESVGGLAVASDGDMYVIRSSYSESSPTDTGLEELSSTGSSEGKFATCKKG